MGAGRKSPWLFFLKENSGINELSQEESLESFLWSSAARFLSSSAVNQKQEYFSYLRHLSSYLIFFSCSPFESTCSSLGLFHKATSNGYLNLQ